MVVRVSEVRVETMVQTMLQTLCISQRDTFIFWCPGDCLRSVPRPLVTVAPMMLGCRALHPNIGVPHRDTTMYLEQLHYLARAKTVPVANRAFDH